MAKKVKFPLDMGNEVYVRTLEELKENYNSEKMTEYFLDGRLLTWLNDRYYDEEAAEVCELSESVDKENPAAKLAKIFDVEIEESVDVEALEIRREKLEKLRQITADDEILGNVDHVAFSQEELGDLLDEEAEIIYLCGESFRIPLSVKNVRYVGVNNPTVTISGKCEIDFEANGITIERCEFSDDTKSRLVKKAEKENDNDILYTSIDDFELEGSEEDDDDDDDERTVSIEKYIGSASVVKIPDIVTKISYSAFKNCKNIEKVIIPKSITCISGKVFCGCEKLESINIPYGVTEIDSMLFYNCRNLTHIDIPESVTLIGEKAFCGCEKLESISIPNSVKKIKKMAFYGCKNLKNVNIPQSVTEIGENAFLKCDKKQINFSNTDIEYNESSIQCNGGFDIEHTDEGIKIFKYNGTEAVVNIPDNVNIIGENAFEECTWVKKINIPESVTEIESSAFINCSSLESINIPSEVTEIEGYTFCNCEKLESIIIPYGITEIGDTAFAGCSNLVSIDIPNSVTEIRDWAFKDCESLESINLSTGIEKISDHLFSGCKRLKSIEIPYNVAKIDWHAFSRCESLTSITIPHSCSSIGNWAFRGCTGLTNLRMLCGVEEIQQGAFEDCTNLVNVEFPNDFRRIEKEAFKNCKNLTHIELPNSLYTGVICGLDPDVFDGCYDINITYGGETYDYDHICDLEEKVKSGEVRFSSISYDDDDDDYNEPSGGLFGLLGSLFS